MITRVGMAPRLRGMSVTAFQEHWRGGHARLALLIPGLRGYVQDHAVLRDGYPLLPYPGFDVCAETDFDDVASMDLGFKAPEYTEAIIRDEQDLIDKTRFSLVLAERRVRMNVSPPEGSVKLLIFLRAHPAYARESFLEAFLGPYAEAVGRAVTGRHEQLITLIEAHSNRQPPACDAIDIIWFIGPDDALAFLRSKMAQEASLELAGRAFGAERLIARPLRMR